MILYKSDWSSQPETVVHVQTKNKSFIKMHYVLKDMGIKNNAFFLALHDPDLQYVDPFDLEKMTPELAGKIAVEVKTNPWYVFREIIRIPATGVEPVPFRLDRSSLFMYWSFFNSVNSFSIRPRQTGKTISSEALIVSLMYFIYKNTRIKLFTHSTDLIGENMEKFKLIRDELPPYLILESKKGDVENKEEVRYGALNNTYATKTAQQTVAGAYNAGRGGTVLVNQFDEMPFCANIDISYPVLMNAKNAAVQSAREAGLPFADLITTTAGRLDSKSGKYVYEIMTKCLYFSEKFYDFETRAELMHALEKGSMNSMLFAEYSYRQLGYTTDWANRIIRENNLKGDEILRDIENKWTSGSEHPAVDKDLLELITDYKIDPVEVKTINDYVFRWYEPEDSVWSAKDRYFVIGMDTSENIDRDFTTIHMLDVADLSTVMTSRCNDQELIKLAMYIANLLKEHKNVVLVPERKSTATVLISLICAELWKAGINPFTRIYNRVFQFRNVEPYSKIDVNTTYASEGPHKKHIGFTTAATGENSRDALYKLTMNKALRLNYAKVRDKNLIDELKSLTLTDMGRIDHSVAGHDDSVIAFLLAAWFVIHGKNHYLYGFPDHVKLSRISADGGVVDVSRANRQRTLGIRITELSRQIYATGDAVVRASLLKEKNFLERQLEALGGEIQSLKSIGDASTAIRTNSNLDEVTTFLSDTGTGRNSYHERFLNRVRNPLL